MLSPFDFVTFHATLQNVTEIAGKKGEKCYIFAFEIKTISQNFTIMSKFKTPTLNTLSAKNIAATLVLLFSTVFPATSYGFGTGITFEYTHNNTTCRYEIINRYQRYVELDRCLNTTLGNNADPDKIILPEVVEYQGTKYEVRWINTGAFRDKTGIECLKLPSKVTEIQPYTFEGCTGLKEVQLPDSLRWIYYNAFQNCSSLESITLPQYLYAIGPNVFKGCRNLKFVAFRKYQKGKIEKGGINETTFDISDIDSDTPIYPQTLYTSSDRLSELQQTSPWNLFGEVKASKGYYVEIAGQMVNDLNRSYINLWNTKFGSSGRIYFDPTSSTLTLDNLKWDYSNHSIIDNFGNPKLTIRVKGECILGVDSDDAILFLAGDNTSTTITNADKNSSLTLRLGAKSSGINASRNTQCILDNANLIIESYPDVDSFESGIDGKPGWGTGGMGNLSIINSVVQITKSPASGVAIGGFLSMKLDGCKIITPEDATIGDDYTICENGEAAKKVLIAPIGHPVGINSAKSNTSSGRKGIYTPDGVRLTTPFDMLPRGIYIVNGKKMMKQ